MASNTKAIGGGRPLRGCDVCGGVDDHPRHVIAGPPGAAGEPRPEVIDRVLGAKLEGEDRARIVAALFDTSSQDRHMDCCREVGCPTGTCDRVAVLGGTDLRGKDLLDHLTDTAELLQADETSKEG